MHPDSAVTASSSMTNSSLDEPLTLLRDHIDLPAEIVAKITHWVIGGPGCYLDKAQRADFLSMRQVSSFWRRTAFSTPYLWRYLHIDTQSDLGGDPYRVMMNLKEILPGWFAHAGQGAEVHLEFGGWMSYGDSHVDWVGMLWGGEQRSYRLATVRFFGDVLLGPSIDEHLPAMIDLRNLSITTDDSWGTPEFPVNLNGTFPLLKSLAFSGPSTFHPLRHSIPHSNIQSLFLSYLTLQRREFAMVLEGLPKLEELIIHNSIFTRMEDFSRVVNTSIQRLVCPAGILLRWPSIILSSLKYFKLIRNTVKRFTHWSDDDSETWTEMENLNVC